MAHRGEDGAELEHALRRRLGSDAHQRATARQVSQRRVGHAVVLQRLRTAGCACCAYCTSSDTIGDARTATARTALENARTAPTISHARTPPPVSQAAAHACCRCGGIPAQMWAASHVASACLAHAGRVGFHAMARLTAGSGAEVYAAGDQSARGLEGIGNAMPCDHRGETRRRTQPWCAIEPHAQG